MEYQIRENVLGIRVEIRCGSLVLRRNEGHTVKVSIPDPCDGSIRVFAHSNTLFIKSISLVSADIQIYIPETLRNIQIITENGSLDIQGIELDNAKINSCSDIFMNDVTIKKGCQLSTENSEIKLISCDISSMSVQLLNGTLEFGNTILHGNNTAYIVNSTVGGLLKGALVDYVVSAGSGIDPDNVIVNDHLLSEFPNRKNVQNCAWLLLAGSIINTARIKIAKPRSGIYK